MFDLQSKDENSNLSSSGTAVLLKFDTLHTLENYIISLLQCLPNDSILSIAINKCSLYCQCQEYHRMFLSQRDLNLQKRKHQNLEKKRQSVKSRYNYK